MKYLILFALCTSCINPLTIPSDLLIKTAHKDYIKYLEADPQATNKAAKLQALKSYAQLVEAQK
jgi:hypothetical protein